MDFIVFDLEWNMAGPKCPVPHKVQKALPWEITEIGASKLNEELVVIDEFHVQVKPQVYQKLNPWVAGITSQKFEDLKENGIAFNCAARQFKEWCGEDFIFCSWSDSDFKPFRENLAYYNLSDTLPAHCLDVQFLFHILADPEGQQRSLEFALNQLEIPLPDRRSFHSAVDDAWFTAAILQKLLYIYAPRLSEQERFRNFIKQYTFDPGLNRNSSVRLAAEDFQGAKDLTAVIDSKGLVCPACAASLVRERPWKVKKNSATTTFLCPNHGQVNAKLGMWHDKKGEKQRTLTLRLPKYLQVTPETPI